MAVRLQTVDDALSILERLAESGHVSVAEVATVYGRSRSSAYRLVKTLRDRRWLAAMPDGTYGVGPLALMLGLRAVRGHPLAEVARPWLVRLTDLSGETSTLSAAIADARVCIDQVESRREIRRIVAVGLAQPLYAGASGRAILSAMTDDQLDRYLASHTFEPLTPATVTDAATLKERVLADRERGYSIALSERVSDAFSVASPVRDKVGVVGSIAICGPASRFSRADADRFGTYTMEAAADLASQLLG